MLGAAGATEAVFALDALVSGCIPASVGADPVDPQIAIEIATHAVRMPLRVVLSNSFAFGGSNVSLVFGEPL
jgi:3-oxoacyl-(acyl-carrier-protein) synthase